MFLTRFKWNQRKWWNTTLLNISFDIENIKPGESDLAGFFYAWCMTDGIVLNSDERQIGSFDMNKSTRFFVFRLTICAPVSAGLRTNIERVSTRPGISLPLHHWWHAR